GHKAQIRLFERLRVAEEGEFVRRHLAQALCKLFPLSRVVEQPADHVPTELHLETHSTSSPAFEAGGVIASSKWTSEQPVEPDVPLSEPWRGGARGRR